MTRDKIGDYTVTKADPAKREELLRDLFKRHVTERCVRNNFRGPTAKTVIVTAWNAKGEPTTFADSYLPQGAVFDTDLKTLNFAAVRFQFWWRILDTGSAAWHTTGPQSWGGEVLPIFGIAWDEHDRYYILWPE